MKKFLVALLTLVCAASLVGNYLLFQRYSSQRPLMAIGSKTITIREYQDALDSRYGKEVLNEMAFRELIRQAATGAKVAATETEVRNRIAAIERRDPKAVEAARNSPERMKELEAQVAANIALENLAIKDVKVTPAEVADFYRRNRSIFRLPSQSRATIALAENPTAAQAVVAMLKDGSINLDSIAGQPGVAVVGVNGFNMDWSRVASDTKRILGGKIATAPTKSVFTVPSKEVTFIVRIDSKAVETVEPFETAKGQAERLLRLRKAEPQANVLARLYRDAEIRFEATKYQVFFKDIEKAGQELK